QTGIGKPRNGFCMRVTESGAGRCGIRDVTISTVYATKEGGSVTWVAAHERWEMCRAWVCSRSTRKGAWNSGMGRWVLRHKAAARAIIESHGFSRVIWSMADSLGRGVLSGGACHLRDLRVRRLAIRCPSMRQKPGRALQSCKGSFVSSCVSAYLSSSMRLRTSRTDGIVILLILGCFPLRYERAHIAVRRRARLATNMRVLLQTSNRSISQ